MKNKDWVRKIFAYIFLGIGFFSILYFIIIALFTAHGTNFYFIWFLLGIIFGVLGFFTLSKYFFSVPKFIRKIGISFMIICSIFFLIGETLILSCFNDSAKEDLDYVIVLGAWLKPTGPSLILKMRLDTAYQYLIEHEDTIVIVSGGQGKNELVSEAQGMAEYLIEKGINPKRIIKEDSSTNTKENIKNSSYYFDKDKDKIGIVTNNFHVFRAKGIAKKEGIKNISGIAAPSYNLLLPNNMLREFLGITKDFIFGNL